MSDQDQSVAKLADLARQVPVPVRDPHRDEELRTRILAEAKQSAAPKPRSRWWIGAVAAGVVALIASALGMIDRGAPVSRATIQASTLASYRRISMQPDEVIELMDGTLEISVMRLEAGERFRVVTGDGEVEVRGTRFTMTVREGRTMLVEVSEGTVDVRVDSEHVALRRGQRWEREPIEEPAPAAPAIAPSPAPPPAKVAKRAIRVPAEPMTKEKSAYPAAFDALAEGDAARAASLFEAALREQGSPELAEDATYWLGVALARAGKRDEARDRFTRLIERFPTSSKSRRASAMLGWLHLEAGDKERAEQAFRFALGDPSPAVRESAESGLRALR